MVRALQIAVVGLATMIVPASSCQASLIVQFVGSNPIASPDYSTEFNSLPNTGSLPDPQSFDGFTFDQINGNSNNIWTTQNLGGGNGKSWYPNGGDNGYTQITLTSGDDFSDVGLFLGGFGSFLAYELRDNGSVVASGVLGGHTIPFHWLSITGGVFDTIRLRDGFNAGISVGDGSFNYLAFDRVEAIVADAAVPEPTSLALCGIGALGMMFGARRRRKQQATMAS